MDPAISARQKSRQQFSNRVSQIFAGIEATAFTASILVLHALLLFAVPQTKDIIAQQNHIWSAFSLQSLFSIFSLCWFSIMCWWTARHVLDQVNTESDRPLDSWVLRWLPLCYGVFPALFLLLSAFLRNLGEVMLTSVLVIVIVSPLLLASSRLKHIQLLDKLKLNHQAFWFWVTLLVTLLISMASIFSLFRTAEMLQAFATLHLGLAGLLFGMTVFMYLLAGLLTRIPFLGFLFEPPVPVLTLAITLAILIAYFVPSDNHGVRRCLSGSTATAAMQCPQAADYQLNGYAFADLPSAWQAYVRQLHQLYPEPAPKRKIPVFFVASQGGGLRASYWTGVVLSEMEHRYPGFHRHIFATAGVSGGAVGNTFYAAQLAEQHQAGTHNLAPILSYRIGRDYLSPVTTSFLNNDLLFRFAPAWFDPYQQDRASILEQSWERGFSCRERAEYCPSQDIAPWQGLAEPLQQVYRRYATDQTKWLPLLMNLGTVQELGVPVITAPWPTTANDFPGSFDVYRLLQCQQNSALQCDIRLSTAALNSARFPFVTPAGSLNYDHASGLTRNPPVYPDADPTSSAAMPFNKKLHIIDGGYFDNFGASTLLQLVNRLSTDPQFSAASDRFDFVPVILVLTNDPKMDASIPTSAAELPADPKSMMANEILAPLQGLLGIWDGHANAALKALLQRYPFHPQTTGSNPLTAQTFVIRIPSGEAYDNLPLGWWLSEESKQLIDQLVCPASQQPPSSQIDAIIGLLPVPPASVQGSPYCH